VSSLPEKVLRGRDLLTLQDLSPSEVTAVIETALKIKANPTAYTSALTGKSLAMVFQKPSTRTRLSFEVAMRQLGGYGIYLRWDDLQLARGEAVKDTAGMFSRYVNGVMARVYRHDDLVELAAYADIPVISGLSDRFHPCQVLSDLLTVREKLGGLKGVKLAYVGDGNNVCNTLLIGCSKTGVDISVACPEGYAPDGEVLKWAEENTGMSGCHVEVLSEPREAVRNADVIYTDTFISMGVEAEREKRLKTFLPKYQVTLGLFKYAKENAYFMHCLPAHRGEEVAAEVIDGPMSIVLDEAENRLHAQKALLYLTL